MLPEIAEPFLAVELVTITSMYGGIEVGGGVLLPGAVVQVPPHDGSAGVRAKPLKLAFAAPPEMRFSFDHC